MAKKRSPKKKPPPKCKAILLCDRTIVEAGTGKASLIGIFDKFFVAQFPGVTSPFMAYVQLVDGIGKYTLSVEVHDLREGTVLAKMPPVEIEFAERITKAVLMFAAPPLPLPHEGSYDFVVLADDQEIDRQKFEASSPGGSKGGENPANQ